MTPAALVLAATLALAPVQPGGHVGAMTVDRGRVGDAQQELWVYCDPVVRTAGVHHRACRVPRFRMIFIGYGLWERSVRTLNHEWRRTKWLLWLDGRRIGLLPFGAYDRRLDAYPPAGGADVTLRTWQVVLIGITPGRHTVRYRSVPQRGRVTDTTWTLTVD